PSSPRSAPRCCGLPPIRPSPTRFWRKGRKGRARSPGRTWTPSRTSSASCAEERAFFAKDPGSLFAASRTTSLAFQPQMGLGEVEAHEAPVPPPAHALWGIGIFVKLRPHIGRRLHGEGVRLKERRHRRLVFEQALEKARKPRQPPRIVERGEPH